VADKILNHQAGTISGVAAVYQRHDFLAERKAALDHGAFTLNGLSPTNAKSLRLTETADTQAD